MAYCAACRDMAAAAPDCGQCEWGQDAPALWPENREAWELWRRVRTQWATDGLGGLLGLRVEAVLHWARLLGIRPTVALLGKIHALERATILASRDQREP